MKKKRWGKKESRKWKVKEFRDEEIKKSEEQKISAESEALSEEAMEASVDWEKIRMYVGSGNQKRR